MPFEYLADSTWLQLTREERQFCAALFAVVRQSPKDFIRLINREATPQPPNGSSVLTLDEVTTWEVGFEVALGRDLRSSDLSEIGSHRKFDLSLFSERQLVVVEAKAQQGFKTEELEGYQRDQKTLMKTLDIDGVLFVGLCSSRYVESPRRKLDLSVGFGKILTWQQIAVQWPDEGHFQRADSVYGK